jgi:hypothetical protein
MRSPSPESWKPWRMEWMFSWRTCDLSPSSLPKLEGLWNKERKDDGEGCVCCSPNAHTREYFFFFFFFLFFQMINIGVISRVKTWLAPPAELSYSHPRPTCTVIFLTSQTFSGKKRDRQRDEY